MKFSFVVITYNHEAYIIEHLESIKYQITTFGEGESFQLIISDDCSKDATVSLARKWLEENRGLFASVEILTTSVNQGTCKNFTGTWSRIAGEYCKITAGDDVFSMCNMLEDLPLLRQVDVLSGYPLMLVDEALSFPKNMIFHIVATDNIYRKKGYQARLAGINVSNTPNLLYSSKVYKSEELKTFINSFSVTEDFPMQIKMAELFRPVRVAQKPKVYVYYRRTDNSTYLIRREHFDKDKNALFQYLHDNSTGSGYRILVRNRISCYNMKNTALARLFNLNYYLYFLRLVAHLPRILADLKAYEIALQDHQRYMDLIRSRAELFIRQNA